MYCLFILTIDDTGNGIRLRVHLQDTSKLQCVEDFLEGMLGKLKFE
jgi:hypothetical protein